MDMEMEMMLFWYFIYFTKDSVLALTASLTVEPHEPSVGGNVLIRCTYEPIDNNVTYDVRWDVNVLPTTGNTKYEVKYNELLFVVDWDDIKNVYKCTVSNGVSSVQNTIKLNPKRPPLITLPDRYECDRSSNIKLRCQAFGNPSQVTFNKWIHSVEGKEIQQLRGNDMGNTSELVISRCSYQDAGSYQCIVGNGIQFPNNSDVSTKVTVLEVRDLPVLIGNTIVNGTGEYHIMVTYLSFPAITDTIKLSKNGKELDNVKKFPLDQLIAYVQHREIVQVQGRGWVITVLESGKYLVTVQNAVGQLTTSIDVWSTKEYTGTSGVVQGPSVCSFMALSFELQVVIVVMIGVVVCVLVLVVALVAIRRCSANTDDTAVKTEKKLKSEGKRQRVKSILEDGSIVYDEIEDTHNRQGKRMKNNQRKYAQNVQEGYEEVDVKPTRLRQNYDMLQRKSKSFFRRLSRNKTRGDTFTSSDHTSRDNVYTDHRAESGGVVYNIPTIPKRNYRADITATIETPPPTYDDAHSTAPGSSDKLSEPSTIQRTLNDDKPIPLPATTKGSPADLLPVNSTSVNVAGEYVQMTQTKVKKTEREDLPDYINLQIKS